MLGGRQIGIGARFRSPDTAAKLVQLGESEAVGTVDDQCVGAWDVETAFDDRGRKQHVIFAIIECAHPVLDLGRGHLAMRDDIFDFGYPVAQELFYIRQVLDPWHDEEALPAAIMFAQQRFAQYHGIPRGNIGADREAIDRRGLDDAEFAQPRHRHLQRARDRRCGERQHMDVGLELFQPLLVDDAETLFLVDDDEAEIFELDRFGDHRMGADDNVDMAACEAVARLLRFGGRDEARQAADFDRKAFETLDEIGEMLAREQGSRADERDLHPRHRCDESGAQRDLGLAEADVAADEPVHRFARRHVGKHIADRAVLIVGFLIGEAVGEGGIGGVGGKRFARAQGALRRGREQFARNLADAVLHPRLAALPCFAAELVEPDAVTLAAVARKDVEIFDGDVELVAA